jgi:uncharacterized protein (DUF2267 family)
MHEHEFTAAVRRSTGLDTPEHTRAAVRATLAVLGQRLSAVEAADLAAQLPARYGDALRESPEVERFDLEEFYRRVADREGLGCSPQKARQHARAVMTAVREAIGSEYRHMLDQLPADYADLTVTENVIH